MLITALEREKKQIYQTGLVEGKREGLVEGIVEGKTEREIEVAKAMLSEGMEIGLISRITALSHDRLLQLKAELSSEER